MNWIEGPLSALIWVLGIAWILDRVILGVKFHVNMNTFWMERMKKPSGPKKKGVYLSDQEEIHRETVRASRESAIAKRL